MDKPNSFNGWVFVSPGLVFIVAWTHSFPIIPMNLPHLWLASELEKEALDTFDETELN